MANIFFKERIGPTIKKYREAAGISQTDLAKQLSASRPTIINWESGKTYPDLPNAQQLCEILNIPIHEILGTESPPAPLPQLPQDESRLMASFRELSPLGKKTLLRIASSMLTEEQDEKDMHYREEYKLIIDEPTPAAAGVGCDYSHEFPSYTFVKQNALSEEADHIVHVSGHSMEPLYKDGDIVYVKKTQEVLSGFDYICDTADGRVIKRAGDGFLYSLNRNLPYPDRYEDDHVRVFGRVVGILRPGDLVPAEEFSAVQSAHHEDVRRFNKTRFSIL